MNETTDKFTCLYCGELIEKKLSYLNGTLLQGYMCQKCGVFYEIIHINKSYGKRG